MEKFFYSQHIAIFGVSGRRSTMASNILENLVKWQYRGGIFLINPAGGKYDGRIIYRSATDVAGPIDMAIVLTKAGNTIKILEDCHAKQIPALCILSGGFSELNKDGLALSKELKRKAQKYKIDILGPNCLGVANTENGLCTPFVAFDKVKMGPVGIISQSGGLSVSLALQLSEESLGFSKLASIGNKLMLDEVDLLRFYRKDHKTEIILMYIESCSRGRELMLEASKTDKPVILFKANTTEAGSSMAWSHTAALRGNHKTFLAGMKQAGVIVADDFNLMGIMAKSFLLPRMKGKRVAVIAGAGGQLVMAADYADKNGFTLPQPGKEVIDTVKTNIRSGVINLSNPMDMGDSLGNFAVAEATASFMAQDNIDGAVVLSVKRPDKPFKNETWTGFTSWVYDRYEKYPEIYGKPLLHCINTSLKDLRKLKKEVSYPVFDNMKKTFQVLRLMSEFHRRRRFREDIRGLKENTKIKGEMDLIDCFEMLEMEKVPIPSWTSSYTLEETCAAGERLGYPVVLKFSSKSVSHKTEYSAVRMDIESTEQMKQAYFKMVKSLHLHNVEPRSGRFVVQKQIRRPAVEMIIGTFRDESFGQTIIVGTGGLLVGLYEDITTRICPIQANEAEMMLMELKGERLLRGFRNTPEINRTALVELIQKVSLLAFANPKIKEMDLNPVLATIDGVYVVDCRIVAE